MNAISIAFTLVTSVFLLALPKRWAALPLLVGAAYATRDAALEIGSAHFTVLRILVAVGVFRVLTRGERLANGVNNLDRLLVLFGVVLMGGGVFFPSEWVFRAGLVWSELGCYLLFRIFIQDWEDVRRIFKGMCVVLVPVAVLMLLEKSVGENFFAALGGSSEVIIRDGHVRARGPFAHAILAGTVGATCFPMALYLWKSHRMHALMGLFAAAGIVLATTSSGPIMMVLFLLLGLALWKVRKSLRALRWLALMAVIALDVVMKDPVYFLMARVDLTGSSTGWHRAALIRSSIEHLDEWWLAGTDYTRHWMASGIHANDAHVDFTNHLLGIGVMGGLPLMFLFIFTLVAGFRAVGRALRENEGASKEHRFLIWTLGALLFGHVVNFFSISLFDQSAVFFYLILACIGAIQVTKSAAALDAKRASDRIVQARVTET